MESQVKYYIKESYGVKRNYPANRMAQKMTQLTNTKTLSALDLAIIQSMGIECVLVHKSQSTLG